MKINFVSNQNFASKNNPIKPFCVNTPKGKVFVSEIDTTRGLKNSATFGLMRFFADNFAENSSIPMWKDYMGLPDRAKAAKIKNSMGYYTEIFQNNNSCDDTTLLLAKDEKGKLQGACLSYCFGFPTSNGKKNLYIDSLAVSPKYRGYNIAGKMLDSISKASTKDFLYSYVTSAPEAAKFYKKNGYNKLSLNDDRASNLLDYLVCLLSSDLIPYIKKIGE